MTEQLIALGGPCDRQPLTVRTGRVSVDVLQAEALPIARALAVDTIPVTRFTYMVQEVAAGAATMTHRAGRRWRVLIPLGLTDAERAALWERDTRPIVDGGHHAGGRPGDGCTDPRHIHRHVCGGCSRYTWFIDHQCRQLSGVPSCETCGSTDWWRDPDPDYPEEMAGLPW